MENDIKSEERKNDNNKKRGLTNYQLINLSHLKIQKEKLIHKIKERNMIHLKIAFDSLTQEIESAERRSERRCPDYDENNRFLKEVDGLIDERHALHIRINTPASVEVEDLATPYDEIITESDDSKSTSTLTETIPEKSKESSNETNEDNSFGSEGKEMDISNEDNEGDNAKLCVDESN